MIQKTVMEQLSRELPETEREEMFRKLKNEITRTDADRETVEYHVKNDTERLKLIKKDMARAGWWERLMVWFASNFSGKKKEEIFASRRLVNLKRQISRKAPGITGFETRNLTPKLAEAVYDIYKTSILLKKHFSQLWLVEGNLERTIVFLLVERIKKAHHALEDFISMEEMVVLYGRGGQKDIIRQEILKRLKDYIDDIPGEEFSEAEKELEPFYYLKDTVLFPYVGFFQLFGFNPVAMPDVKKPFFQNASAMLTLKFLEKLHFAGMFDSMLSEPFKISPLTIKAVSALSSSGESGENENKEEHEDLPEIAKEEKLRRVINDIGELHKKMQRFYRNIPVLDLLRFFHKDPYFNLNRNITGLHFQDFYYMILKNLLLTKLEDLYPEIKTRYIQKEIDNLFTGKIVFTLQNYRIYSSIDYDKMGLPFFRHTQSLNLLYNYIKVFYREYFYDTFQLLDKNILVGNRITRDKLEKCTNSFEEIAQKILEFDYSISPDSDDGKLFQRLRFSLASESSHQKMFRTLVLQKDREVKSILERADEDIGGLIKLIEDLLTSPVQTVKSQLNTHYILRGKSAMLAKLLSSRSDHLRHFRGLLSQITKEERN